uniref:Very-long-chain (3R)-3-hydroxyacyl-CoA dehydratase n=1 Tax=Anopheles stephensi TaxID=30069 RepID=A0A182XXC5_ANOST
MARRNVWSGEETMELLEIIKEHNFMYLFATASRGQKEYDVYRMIEEEMQKNGFNGKDAGQIYHKWKNLKRAFYQSKKQNKGRAICEFAEELADILERPCALKRREPDPPVEPVEGEPAPVKKRNNAQIKTIRSQIVTKLAKAQSDNSEEFAKKWNDLNDYEFKLYKRKEKEQTVIVNRLLEDSKTSLMTRCRDILAGRAMLIKEIEDGDDEDDEEDDEDHLNVIEIVTTDVEIAPGEEATHFGTRSLRKRTGTMAAKEPSPIVKSYLILYNAAQVLGWCYMLYQLIAYYTIDKGTQQTLWEYLGFTVILFQNAALLEIVHAFTRIVPSNPVITTFQVLSRVMVVCGVVMATPTGKVSPGLPLAILAWSVTEIIRYAYYALNLIDAVPGLLIFLRYTTFIVLYPTGVTGELLCFFWAQSHVAKTKQWSIEMPNTYNFTFSYLYFLWAVMLLYIPLFPQLYMHMFAQRKKILGSGSSGAGKQKKN